MDSGRGSGQRREKRRLEVVAVVSLEPPGSSADRLRQVLRPEDQLWSADDVLVVRPAGIASLKDARRLGERLLQGLGSNQGVAVAVVAQDRAASVEALVRQGRQALAADHAAPAPAVVFRGGSAASGPVPPSRAVFVGRNEELAKLSDALACARQGSPRVGAVEGESGIGKSTLIRRWVTGVAPTTVLWASGEDAESTIPWGILRQLAAGASPPLAGDLGELTGNLDPDAEPLLIGGRLLAIIGEHGDTAVIVDDAHLADPQSLAALCCAGRRMTVEPVLILVAHSPEGQVVLGDGWRRLVESEAGFRLRLGGLAPPDLAGLASLIGRGPLSAAGARRLWEQTAGHPLFARDLLERLPGDWFEHDEGPLPAPPGPAQWARERLALCEQQTRRLVEAVAVIGVRSPLASAVAVSGVLDGAAAVSEAVSRGLLQEAPDGHRGWVAFAHPLLRNAVYHNLPAARRRELHLKAAAASAGGAALEHRWAAATGPDEQLADDLEAWGRAEVARAAPPRATRAFHRALLLSPPGAERTRRLLLTAEALLVAGDANAAAAYEEELGALDEDPWVDYVVGYLSLVRGRSEDAVARLGRAWRSLQGGVTPSPGAPDDLAARVASQLAIVAVVSLDSEAMIRFGEAAVGAGAHERWVGAFAGFAHTIGLALGGRAEEALALFSGPGWPGGAAGLDGLVARGMVRLWTDDLVGARVDLLHAVERAGRGEPLRVSQALAFLGEVEYRSGHLAEAVLHMEDAVAQAEAGGRFWDLPMLHGLAALPRMTAGDWPEAETHVRRSKEWADLVGTAVARAYSSGAAGALAERRGRVQEQVVAARDFDVAFACPEPGAHVEGPLLARGLVSAGALDEAEEALDRFEARARATGRRSSLMAANSARGQLEAAKGSWEAAAASFEQALAVGAGLPLPLELARVHAAYGRAALSARRRADARRHLLTALSDFERAGAIGLVQEVLTLMDHHRLLPRRREPQTGLLTAAEGAVARLAAEGLGNADIARRLFISTKTVEYHLTRVFAKLGVRSRRQLADRMAGEPHPN